MHIIAGQFKGKNLRIPEGKTTRPTAQRVRQALFDILAHAPWGGTSLFDNTHILDGFAGTGALGLEALSRGAAFCSFFENDPTAFSILRHNITLCKTQDRTRLYRHSLLQLPSAPHPCKLIFLDPPYSQNLPFQASQALIQKGWINKESIIVIEAAKKDPLPFDPIPPLMSRFHGAAQLSIWEGQTLIHYFENDSKNPPTSLT